MWIGRFDEPVVSPLAIAARSDESGATQVCEVPRNLRLIRLENLDAIADAELFVTEELDESQTSAISQGFEKCFEVSAHSFLITISRFLVFGRDLSHKGAKFKTKPTKRNLNLLCSLLSAFVVSLLCAFA